jgi:hypothetical protein
VTGASLSKSTMSGVLDKGFQVGDRNMSSEEGLQAGVTEPLLGASISMSMCDVSK